MSITCGMCGSQFISENVWVADDDAEEVIVMFVCQECKHSWKETYSKV